MWFLTLLCGILCIMYPVSGELDKQCVDTCKCCIDEKCGPQYEWDNVCKIGCIDGHRGARCYDLCKYKNCKNCGGGSLSTVCTECYDGYYLGPNKNCTSQCPYNCKSCNSSTMCTECKEGFYDKDGSTTCLYAHCPKNCVCTDGQFECMSCKKGFFDTSSFCLKKCPMNCLTCESEQLCNECQNGFYNGFEYDISVTPPLNNCSYTCRDTCTKCQSYNNCLRCEKGKYGSTCQEDCSIGCKDMTCATDTGQCGCAINFTGKRCVECVDGYYGPSCNRACSSLCVGNVCKRDTGICTKGCAQNQDEPECASVPETSETVYKENTTIAAVLGSLLSLTVLIIVVQAIVIIVLRRKMTSQRMPKREQFSTAYENQQASPEEDHDYQRINSIPATATQQ